MAKEEFEIEIGPTGKVTVRTIGIKGPRCIDCAETIARIVGREESRELTSEYYETESDVASHIDQSGRASFYESVSRALKPGGRLVIFGPHGGADPMLEELRGFGFFALDDDALGKMSSEERDRRLAEGVVFREK